MPWCILKLCVANYARLYIYYIYIWKKHVTYLNRLIFLLSHNGFRTRTGGYEFWLLPWRWHILPIPLKAGRGISAENCGLDGVFPIDDIGAGPSTPFIIYIPHISAAFLLLKYTLSKRHTYQKLVWPCWCIGWFDTVWFQVCFQLYVPVFSMSWYRYRYLWHCTLVSSTPWLYSQSDWFLVVRASAESHQVLLSPFPWYNYISSWFSSWLLWLSLGFLWPLITFWSSL